MMNKKNGLSIRTKMFLQISAIMLVAVLVILFLGSSYLGDIYLYNKKQEMTKLVEYVDGLDIKSGIYFGTVKSLEIDKNLSIDIFDKDGTPLYTSNFVVDNLTGQSKIISKEELKNNGVIEIFENNSKQFLLLKQGLSFGGEAEVLCSKDTVDENANSALVFTYGAVIFIFLISLVFVYIYTGRFTKPLIEMSNAAESIANLDFSKKCRDLSNDELGNLAKNINNISSSLNITLNDLNRKNQQLSDDIEKKQTLDQLRKEFISSISHELKTPIAIIKGYAEGAEMMAESGDFEGVKEYCSIIGKESDKMNGLVYELLELSRYELGDNQLAIEDFPLKSFIESYTESEKLAFEEKGISFSYNVPDDAICKGDFVKLTMVLNNYISNAISHIKNEKILKIFCREYDDFYRVYVFNSGDRIKNEDIDKIWNSFYRADKSHSRREGRFGLGLSIVSAIQNLHNQKYGVYNEEDGVVFWFDIKKA